MEALIHTHSTFLFMFQILFMFIHLPNKKIRNSAYNKIIFKCFVTKKTNEFKKVFFTIFDFKQNWISNQEKKTTIMTNADNSIFHNKSHRHYIVFVILIIGNVRYLSNMYECIFCLVFDGEFRYLKRFGQYQNRIRIALLILNRQSTHWTWLIRFKPKHWKLNDCHWINRLLPNKLQFCPSVLILSQRKIYRVCNIWLTMILLLIF